MKIVLARGLLSYASLYRGRSEGLLYLIYFLNPITTGPVGFFNIFSGFLDRISLINVCFFLTTSYLSVVIVYNERQGREVSWGWFMVIFSFF